MGRIVYILFDLFLVFAGVMLLLYSKHLFSTQHIVLGTLTTISSGVIICLSYILIVDTIKSWKYL